MGKKIRGRTARSYTSESPREKNGLKKASKQPRKSSMGILVNYYDARSMIIKELGGETQGIYPGSKKNAVAVRRKGTSKVWINQR